jgi:hypothetical protein
MIQYGYPKKSSNVYLCIIDGSSGFEIQTLEVPDPKAFIKGQTVLIKGDNPNLLWDLLHGLMGIPYPQLNKPEPQKDSEAEVSAPEQEIEPEPEISASGQEIESEPEKNLTPLEKELMELSAKDIIKKVEQEKGIQITNSLKSKAAIIKKALKIYMQ